MNLIINGENKHLPGNFNVSDLLTLYKLDDKKVVVELNNIILEKEKYKITSVKENDSLEIVTFVGGG